jgi:hypothetical protein
MAHLVKFQKNVTLFGAALLLLFIPQPWADEPFVLKQRVGARMP